MLKAHYEDFKAKYFQYASHIIDLVLNALSYHNGIRNTAGTITGTTIVTDNQLSV